MKIAIPPTYFLGAIILAAALHVLVPVHQLLTFPWRLFGLIPVVVGIVLSLLARRAFTIHETTIRPFEESSALLTTGVFGISRNPIYLGLALILLGIAVLFGSATPFVVVLVFPMVLDRLFITPEQRMLEATFGERYRHYRERVRKWI